MAEITSLSQQLTDILISHIPDLWAVYLFGSICTDRFNADSDIDIAFIGAQSVDSIKRWDIQEIIAAQLHKDIDLVDMRSATTIMQKQIIETGQRVYCGAQFLSRVEHFESKCIWLYIDLMELNAPLYARITKDKSVYHG